MWCLQHDCALMRSTSRLQSWISITELLAKGQHRQKREKGRNKDRNELWMDPRSIFSITPSQHIPNNSCAVFLKLSRTLVETVTWTPLTETAHTHCIYLIQCFSILKSHHSKLCKFYIKVQIFLHLIK